MTDTELDEILDQWSTPSAPPALRDRVRMGFPSKKPKKAWGFTPQWKGLLAGTVLAGLAILLVVGNAPSQPQPAVPWTVDSEYLQYDASGSSSVKMRTTSYELNGTEVLVSRSVPGDPIRTALGRAFDAASPALNHLSLQMLGLVNPGMLQQVNQEKRARLSRPPSVGFIAGCDELCLSVDHYFYPKVSTSSRCIEGPVVDRATILNYPTEAVQERWTEHGRMTVWTAPQLGCFALKETFEHQEANGTFRLVVARQALRVTMSR